MDKIRHIKYEYYDNGLDSLIDGEEVNETIEEIMEILIRKKVTVSVAKQILEDTISSIEKEALFEKRIINNQIK